MEQEINQKIEERKNGRAYSNIIVALWRYGFENEDDEAVAVDCLEDVVKYVGKKFFRDDAINEPNISIQVQGKVEDLSDKYVYFKSETYKSDDRNGVCADGDPLSVRYARIDNGRVFKMKCGKFFRRLIDEMHPELPEPVRVYFSEQLSAMYRAGHAGDGRYTLTLDRDFERIYSGYYFGSCMADKGQWKFYRDSSPDALAAGLWDGEKLIARCIVWNKVYDCDEDGKTYRLAERQYGDSAEARRQLIYLLAEQGKIDGHKQFESGCYDGRNYVLLDGTSLRDKHLYVVCTAHDGDVQSFQDSFRFLNFDEEQAYNWDGAEYDIDIATTNSRIQGRDAEDGDEHDGQIYVAADGEWYDEEDVYYLEYRNEYRHSDDITYSECEGRDLLDDDATSLWDNDYCHCDNAVEIEAGEHRGEYMWEDDDERTQDYDNREVLECDCYKLTAGEYEGEYAPKDECAELDWEFYGTDAYALDKETVETEYGETILDADSVEIYGCIYHKSERVRAMDTRVRKFINAFVDDCVEICGTYYFCPEVA